MRKRKQYYKPYGGRRSGPIWLLSLLAVALIFVLGFVVLLGIVLWGGRDQLNGQSQVMVILGCQANPDGPSVLLRDRLDEALDYLEDHPDLTIVVAGGQGDDEVLSEAQCMYDYLTAHGVDGAQILLEDQSHNTWENLRYTKALLAEQEVEATDIVVVSNGFHLARVRMLWDRVWGGETTLSTLAAPSSHLPSRLSMYIREPFALVKSFFFDR